MMRDQLSQLNKFDVMFINKKFLFIGMVIL